MDLAYCYSVIRNEEVILPYFLRWYSTFCEKITLFDGGSDDDTQEIARAHPKVELRKWEMGDQLDDTAFVDFANQQYKEARGKAHFVCFPDCDELIYHPNIRGLLKSYHRLGVTLPGATGYTMLDNKLPTTSGQIWEEMPYGLRDNIYDKTICFNPMVDLKWSPGKHGYDVGGWIVKPEHLGLPAAELKLLHYRYIQREYVVNRKKRNYSRASALNKEKSYGFTDFPSYLEGKYSMSWYDQALQDRYNVVDPIDHTSVQGWFDYGWCYDQAVNQMEYGDQCVEVGTWLGASTIYLGKAIIRSGKNITLHAVDTFSGTPQDPSHGLRLAALQSDPYYEFMQNLRDAGTLKVTNPVKLPSVEAAQRFTDNTLGFIYLDGDHRYEGISADIKAWWPKVKPGAMMAGHDYSSAFPDVVRAVNDFKKEIRKPISHHNGVWSAIKS